MVQKGHPDSWKMELRWLDLSTVCFVFLNADLLFRTEHVGAGERWLSSQGCALLLQKTRVWFPAPMLLTPAPGDLAPSSGFHGYLHTYICAQPHTYTKLKKIKPIAALGRQRPADLLVGSPA